MRAASGTLAMSRLGPGCDTRAYIWPRSWRKLETLTAPMRPECAFDPKGDSRQPCVRSEPEALPGLLGGPLFFMRGSPPPVRPPTRSLSAQNCFRFHNQACLTDMRDGVGDPGW